MANDIPLTGSNLMTGSGITGSGTAINWSTTADSFWRDKFGELPYVAADRNYEFYRPGFRYGTEAAAARNGRSWEEMEPELRRGWETYEHRADCPAPWTEMTPAVLDAWTRYCSGETARLSDDSSRGRERGEP